MLQPISDDLLDGADAAAGFLGLDVRKVRRLTESGHLPVIRKGRKLFYLKTALHEAFYGDTAAAA